MPEADRKYHEELQEFFRLCFNEKGEEIRGKIEEYMKAKESSQAETSTDEKRQVSSGLSY